MFGSTPSDKYVTLCAICGHALMREEVGTIVTGNYIDYRNVTHGDIEIILCSECWEKLRDTLDKGIEFAIKKRRSLEYRDRWAVKEIPQFQRHGDDDDEIPAN